ncbi:MAG: hypothetical protein PHE06_05065 [Lachnospiraceae bacterium]|nr:hypothetical protein [Lachnospiraceae bacterium]
MTAFVLNLCIVIFELIGIATQLAQQGAAAFQFYTLDSNILALAASVCYLVYVCRHRSKDRCEDSPSIPGWVHLLKYLSTCCLTVTFVVVITVLAPAAGVGGYQKMLFSGTMLFHHFLCPVLSLISYIFFEGKMDNGRRTESAKKDIMIAVLPTFIYAVIALILNIMKIMNGPYPFLHIYEQPVMVSVFWFVGILLGAALFAALIRFLRQKLHGGSVE